MSEKALGRALAGLVSKQMEGVSKDWAGFLGASVSFDPPEALGNILNGVSELPPRITLTELEVEGDIQGRFFVAIRVEDAFGFCAELLGRSAPSAGEEVNLDAEILDALHELFNLFCGGTDKALRKGADSKLHVKQVSTRAEGQATVSGVVGPSSGLVVRVSLSIGRRKGVRLWEFFPPALADALVASHGTPRDAVGGKAAGTSILKRKVLVVDDQHVIRMLVKRYLDKGDYEVLEAESGEMALHVFRKEHVDVLLLDVMMPNMDGIEVCRRIRALPGGKNGKVPIIMCTAISQRQSILDAVKAGANDYIVKPFTPETLIMKLRKALPAQANP